MSREWKAFYFSAIRGAGYTLGAAAVLGWVFLLRAMLQVEPAVKAFSLSM